VFLWFTTWKGLVRYDGYQHIMYTAKPTATPSPFAFWVWSTAASAGPRYSGKHNQSSTPRSYLYCPISFPRSWRCGSTLVPVADNPPGGDGKRYAVDREQRLASPPCGASLASGAAPQLPARTRLNASVVRAAPAHGIPHVTPVRARHRFPKPSTSVQYRTRRVGGVAPQWPSLGPGRALSRDCAARICRTCAKLCRAAGGELEQIPLLLGHTSVQTTERYLRTKRDLVPALNDGMKLKRGCSRSGASRFG